MSTGETNPTNIGEWIETLELGEQSPNPIINHFNQLLERARRTNDEIELLEMEETDLQPPSAGAALRGPRCEAPAPRGAEDKFNETSANGEDEMVKKTSKSEVRAVAAASTVGTALLAMIDPLIAKLDSFGPQGVGDNRNLQSAPDMSTGHALPSMSDLTLRITLSNFCYNVHQQINGGPKFGGIKASYDKAAQAWSNLCIRYESRPEQMEADPDSDKFFAWYEQTGAKLEFLEALLDQLKDVYYKVTGESWAPRPTETVKATVDPKRAERMLAAKRAAFEARNQISEDSVLIKAQG